MNSHFFEEQSLSLAWGKMIRKLHSTSGRELAPIVVSVTGFDENGVPQESANIRDALEAVLAQNGKQPVETVASTIFPFYMWNPNAPRSELYERYLRIFPRLQAASSKNRHGIYFQRIITGGPTQEPNQLEFILKTFTARDSVRRSMLQIAIYDPTRDLTAAAQRGFPCLQHVTFAPTTQGLSVNAFYATQFMIERAYGNYLGLCRLGRFVAQALDMKLARVTCYTGIALEDLAKTKLQPIIAAINAVAPEEREEDDAL